MISSHVICGMWVHFLWKTFATLTECHSHVKRIKMAELEEHLYE